MTKKKTATKKTKTKTKKTAKKKATKKKVASKAAKTTAKKTTSSRSRKSAPNLVIVESPSKAKTLKKYLGKEFNVVASKGHIKDLPKSKLGVEPGKSFIPTYDVIKGKDKVIEDLLEAAKNATHIWLAPDPDREGEAIAYHVAEVLKAPGKKFYRVLFNSITKKAVNEAIQNPVELDESKYNSQQARRILDRIVGYKLSPLLWDKVQRGLSAGRVQSVAVRLVVEKEVKVKAFKPREFWEIKADFIESGNDFTADLKKIKGEDVRKKGKKEDEEDTFLLTDEAKARKVESDIQGKAFDIAKVDKRETSRKPTAPFITSKLQQEASSNLNFSAQKTMSVAQKLYEGVDLGKDLGDHGGTVGLITYMRTDSTRIAPEAITEVREFIDKKWGKDYLPAEPVVYKNKKANVQDAHEAIRPTSLMYTPERIKGIVEPDFYNLYVLIWNKFIASQMMPAIYDQTGIDLTCVDYQFRVSGRIVKFDGFRKVYSEYGKKAMEDGQRELPPLNEGDSISPTNIDTKQNFTQPPPRFTESSLIKELEEKEIGRPSTYASILSNIERRNYVEKHKGRYFASELGIVVTDLLVEAFPSVMDVEFTAGMEAQLDEIETGERDWQKTLEDFWVGFEKRLEQAKESMKNMKAQEIPTKIKCEKDDAIMLIRWGKHGQYLSCSNYPDCKSTLEFKKDDEGEIVPIPPEYKEVPCPDCAKPKMLVRNGKFGSFLACLDYPDCKGTKAITTGISCPECDHPDGELCKRRSRFGTFFYSCARFPDCKYAMWEEPVNEKCPDCGHPVLGEKFLKRSGLVHRCPKKECHYKKVIYTPEEMAAREALEVPA